MCSGGSNTPLRVLGCPIQTSTDRRLVGTSPWLIAASHVFHRFSSPRHPPLALNNLGIAYKDARARYEILKKRRRAELAPGRTRRCPRERGGRRTFTTEDRTGTSGSSAPWRTSDARAPDECINWVSRLDTERMSVNRAELDSLERR